MKSMFCNFTDVETNQTITVNYRLIRCVRANPNFEGSAIIEFDCQHTIAIMQDRESIDKWLFEQDKD